MEKYNLGLINRPPQTLENLQVTIDLAKTEDAEVYRKIRLEAIDQDPEAFDMQNEKKRERQKSRDISEWKKDIQEQVVLLAKNDSEVIGLVKGVDRGQGLWSINNVYLTPAFRKNVNGAPIGDEMIKKVLDEIKNRGGQKARLWVKNSNKGATKFYEVLGFKKIETRKAMSIVGKRIDLLIGWSILEKDLNAETK